MEKLKLLFPESQRRKKRTVQVMQQLAEDYNERGVELIEVASGYRFKRALIILNGYSVFGSSDRRGIHVHCLKLYRLLPTNNL